jgi:thiamine pyrophosphate-dependent acetolactate synthase large subunit-like protein
MAKISGAQAVVKSLEREGVEMVFGIPGFHNMPIFDALYHHPRIKHMAVRHEQGAAFMADGYARASGRIAAVLLLPGPGVTNAYTGLGEAYSDSSPVLLLATQVNREYIDRNKGLLHELTGQFDILAPIMKYSERVTEADGIPDAVHRAMTALRNGRPRPVQIEIPRDVQLDNVEWSEELSQGTPAYQERIPAPAEESQTVAQALRDAKRPLIYAGGGVISSEASDVLIQLAERLGAPVLTTGMGAGSIPGDHPLACGVAWIASADIRPLVAASDAFLAVGTRFNEAMTHGWSLDLPPVTIRIDVDADEIERNLPMQHKLVGDARATLTAIDNQLAAWGEDRQAQIPPQLATARNEYRAALETKMGSTRPCMEALRDSLPRDTIISADMSLFWADMLAIFPIYQPRTMLFPWGYGTLGFSIPEALGAKAALPERPVVAIAGDGAFLFTGMELATAVKYSLNIPILVPNNDAYGMIKVQQRNQYDEQYTAVDLHNPDFVQLAHAFGVYGERVTTPAALGEAVNKALVADKPTVIEIPWGWTWGIDGIGNHG